MADKLISLDQISVKTPCTMDWELMDGDDRIRFCAKCEKNVYNLSMLDEPDTLKLLNSGNGGKDLWTVCSTPRWHGCIRIVSQVTWLTRIWLSVFVAGTVSASDRFGLRRSRGPWIHKTYGPTFAKWFGKPDVSELQKKLTEDITIQPPPQAWIVGEMELPIPDDRIRPPAE